MFDQNIGCELSCFYEGWACLLEQLGNYKKADAVYQNGRKKNARPYEHLKSRHEYVHKTEIVKFYKKNLVKNFEKVHVFKQFVMATLAFWGFP